MVDEIKKYFFRENKDKGIEKPLDPMTCEMSIMIEKKLRYTRFISTVELEKLNTCHNLEELNNYFKMEEEILNIVLKKDSNLKNKSKFQTYVKFDESNEAILSLIQDYVSFYYFFKYAAKDFNSENIIWVKIFVEKNKNDRFFMSNIEVVNK